MELDNLYIHPTWRQGYEAQHRDTSTASTATAPARKERRAAPPVTVGYPTALLVMAFFAAIGIFATCGVVIYGLYLLAGSALVAEAIQNYDVSDALFTTTIVILLCAWGLREAMRD
ncbi:MAG: hypothetical protein IT567_05245 [Alphaproteobacteria bacterium]|nr:hypothetical protein [Alphaproteobacteria bacterium]